MSLFGVIVFFGVVVLIDLPTIMKTNQRTKTMFVYFFLISVGLIISVLLVIDKAPISPAKLIEIAVKALLGR